MKSYLCTLLLAAFCSADLRMAAQPKNSFHSQTRNRQAPFVPKFAFYMEPSDFGYEGLKKQRDGGGYDNFLRSNIDNEQDRRNFQTEPGKDHLPFRSYETASVDTHASVKHKLPNTAASLSRKMSGQYNCTECSRDKDKGNLCASENKPCACKGTVAYGGNGKFNTEVSTGTITCNNKLFGDPVFGTRKYCYCLGAIKEEKNFGTGPVITVDPGEPFIVPLRWNNPHSSELEVNVWVMQNKYVVPIRKPTCSGEGHQDNVFTFTVPKNFNSNLNSRIPGFKGCKTKGDCVLQVYAHSVESRTYAIGMPIVITGDLPPGNAPTLNVGKAQQDRGLNLDTLRKICLPSNDPSADITNAVPRMARMISDVANHAYQNSDFSPYSGQQPEAISQNMQASAILKMVTGNRGELGKYKLARDNRDAYNFQRKIEKKAKELVRVYESITNQIIAAIGMNMTNTDTSMEKLGQKTVTCFRCAEVGAVNAKRKTTNTYVPSFVIPKNLLAEARMYIAPIRGKLITPQANGDGLLQIYQAVLSDMTPEFIEFGQKYKMGYQSIIEKDGLATKDDVTKFRKTAANGKPDKGYYAATEAGVFVLCKKENKVCEGEPPRDGIKNILVTKSLNNLEGVRASYARLLASEESALITAEGDDMDGLNKDSNCDDDSKVTLEMVEAGDSACVIQGQNAIKPGQLFAPQGVEEYNNVVTTSIASKSSFSGFVVLAALGAHFL